MIPELPEGWASCTLADLTSGGLFSDGDWIETKDQDLEGDVRLIQLADIGDRVYRNRSNRFLTSQKAAELNCTFLSPGDLLVARMPEPLGRACRFPGDPKRAVTAVDVCIVRPNPLVNDLWLLYTLNAPQFRQSITEFERGTTRKRVSRANLGRITFGLPPVAEQRRIVQKVEALLARIEAVRQYLRSVLATIERFRQSVLAAASAGDLTAAWRGTAEDADFPDDITASELPRGWRRMTLGEVSSRERTICYGVVQPGEEYPDGGVRLVRVCDLSKASVRLGGLRSISPGVDAEYRRSRLRGGEILVSVVGTIGRVAVAQTALAGANIARAIARIVPKESTNAQWLAFYLMAPRIQERLHSEAREVARKTLNIEQLSSIEIAVPPPEEQDEIARQARSCFAIADVIEKRTKTALASTELLVEAILAKAFAGELLPTEAELTRRNGRDYESATALLKRIHSERKPRPARTRRSNVRSNLGQTIGASKHS